MSLNETPVNQIRALVEPILADRRMELVELTARPQGGQLHIRLLVDHIGGVTIQQCAQANQLIALALKASNVIETGYTLEVSSPGVDRPLVSQRDFERAIGEELRVNRAAPDGRMQELQGVLLAVRPEAIVLKTASRNLTLSFAEIRMAKKARRWSGR